MHFIRTKLYNDNVFEEINNLLRQVKTNIKKIYTPVSELEFSITVDLKSIRFTKRDLYDFVCRELRKDSRFVDYNVYVEKGIEKDYFNVRLVKDVVREWNNSKNFVYGLAELQSEKLPLV